MNAPVDPQRVTNLSVFLRNAAHLSLQSLLFRVVVVTCGYDPTGCEWMGVLSGV